MITRKAILLKETRPDSLGRVRFTLLWWGYNPSLNRDSIRAQCFFAKPEDHAGPNTDIRDALSNWDTGYQKACDDLAQSAKQETT
jgi:hypothetical protein